jgi:hypothetical protein
MTSETSVVTPERFGTGIPDFPSWMAAIEQRKDEFQKHYDEYEPNEDDLAAIRTLVEQRGVKAMVLGEDWCPDVWRGVPVIAKVAERTGMELRLFKRDENKDMMAEFLNKGEFESIPTIVFYDGDHRYLGHWIERAVVANEEIAGIREEIMAGVPAEGPERDAAMARYRAATMERAAPWRHAQVTEIRALLEKALS